MKKLKRAAAFILSAVIALDLFFVLPVSADVLESLYDTRFDIICKAIKQDEETLKASDALWQSVVFISVSDGKSRAQIVSASSSDLFTALGYAQAKAKKLGVVPKWYKVDVVTSYEQVTYADFIKSVKGTKYGTMRKGVSFNEYFGTALLEAHINSEGILNYETGRFDLTKVNKALAELHKRQVDAVPAYLYTFETKGFFCENNSYAYKLNSGTYNSVGRREVEIDRRFLETMAQRTSEYFCSICGKDGKFVYGYYPIDNVEMEDYNIIRHAGTVWDLIMLYDMCRDERAVKYIEKALDYLKTEMVYKNKTTAFIKNYNTLNVGGNGLALIAYCTYAEIFGSTKYNKEIRALANGILYMQKSDGSFIHEIAPETYETVRDYVIVFYDGEAMYGMAKAYGLLKKDTYLNCVRKAADNFIQNKYETLHSHWIAYGFNELTKYDSSVKYYEFGLKNINEEDYSSKLCRIKTASHTSAETAGAAFELYDRLMQSGIQCGYLNSFKADKLTEAVKTRIEYGLNYYMFPEYAMYFEDPATVAYSLAVREDFFRIRIDDIQHFMDGYYLYWKNFDRIEYYTEQADAA